MANRYWVGGTGTWDVATTTHWSATSGGLAGASFPTATDDVFFDANSFSGAGQVVTISGSPECHNLDISTATNNPTFSDAASLLIVNGSFVGNSNVTFDADFVMQPTGGSVNLTTNGMEFKQSLIIGGSGTITLQDDLVSTYVATNAITFQNSVTFNTNGFDITTNSFRMANTVTVNMGNGTWTVKPNPGVVSSSIAASTVTLNANSSTLVFDLSLLTGTTYTLSTLGVRTFYNVFVSANLTTNILFFSGNDIIFNNFSVINSPITLRFTEGRNYTFTTLNLNGSVNKLITLTSLGGSQINFTATHTSISYVDVYNNFAHGNIPFLDYPGGIDSGDNTNWIFSLPAGLSLQTVHLVGSDPAGDVQQLNVSKDDDSTPIYYELETQEQEFGNRAFLKTIYDKLGIVSQYADDSKIEIIPDNFDAIPINIDLGKRTTTATLPALKGHYLTLRWSGNSTTKSPILEGFYLSKIKDDSIG